MGRGCLHWQIHYKEVAAKCVLPQILAVTRSFFYSTHKKSCFSMLQSLNISFTKKNICTTLYKVLLFLELMFQKGCKPNKSSYVFGQGDWLSATCTTLTCICSCQGCPVMCNPDCKIQILNFGSKIIHYILNLPAQGLSTYSTGVTLNLSQALDFFP